MSAAPSAAARVMLRPLTAADADTVATWLAEAMAAVDGSKAGLDTPASLGEFCARAGQRWPGARIDAVVADGRGLVGLLVRRALDAPPRRGDARAVVIDALTVRRDARDVGYGAEAVERLEEEEHGAMVYAAVPRANGLALYFWLRVGYRPVQFDEAPDLVRDAERLWMVRDPSRGRPGAKSDC